MNRVGRDADLDFPLAYEVDRDSVEDCRDAIQAVIALGPADGLRREEIVTHAGGFGYGSSEIGQALDALGDVGEVYGVPTGDGREWRNTEPQEVVGRFLR